MKFWPRRTAVNLTLAAGAFVAGYFGYTYALDQQFARAEDKRHEVQAGLAHAEDLATAFRQVGKVVEPSVVNILVQKKAGPMPQVPEEFRRFFREPGRNLDPDAPGAVPRNQKTPKQNPDDESDDDEMPDTQGQGSGVIMEYTDGKGYILTNNHVAGGAEKIVITLADGRTFSNGKVLGTDPKSDLALIEIKADRLSPAKWGNSDELQKGDWIMAFGSPFGFVGSMTHGIVSALNRQADILSREGYENFIQVDAPINPGNSGGPLVNLRGEVVGINTAIISRSGGFQGLGFAIPSNQAHFVFDGLREKGKVIRGWLGVGIEDIAKNARVASYVGYEKPIGVLIEQIFDGTPAIGKLKPGDIITEVKGKPVSTVQELRSRIASIQPGEDINMKIFRDKKESDVVIKLGEQPEDVTQVIQPRNELLPKKATSKTAEMLGMTLQTMTEDLADRRELEHVQGAVITRIQRNSAAAKLGLSPGDVIIEIDKRPIESIEQFTEAIDKADETKGALAYVYFSRNGAPGVQRYVVLQAEK